MEDGFKHAAMPAHWQKVFAAVHEANLHALVLTSNTRDDGMPMFGSAPCCDRGDELIHQFVHMHEDEDC